MFSVNFLTARSHSREPFLMLHRANLKMPERSNQTEFKIGYLICGLAEIQLQVWEAQKLR